MSKPGFRTLLIVWHSRTDASRQMAEAARQGALEIVDELGASDIRIVMKRARDTQHQDLLHASGYLFVAPENLASLSGEMKEFFDRNYYAVLDQLNGRPYALMIAAGSDGSMAARQTERICTGWRLQQVAATLIVNTRAQSPEAILAPKQVDAASLARCREHGATLAALLAL